MSDDGPDFVRVRFKLAIGEEGWPPVSSEGLWAEPLGDDEYRIDNTPWFARNLAADDVVRAVAGDDGVLWATEKVRWSGRLTIRVVPFPKAPLRGDRQAGGPPRLRTARRHRQRHRAVRHGCALPTSTSG